jgi:hypothetical protein
MPDEGFGRLRPSVEVPSIPGQPGVRSVVLAVASFSGAGLTSAIIVLGVPRRYSGRMGAATTRTSRQRDPSHRAESLARRRSTQHAVVDAVRHSCAIEQRPVSVGPAPVQEGAAPPQQLAESHQ